MFPKYGSKELTFARMKWRIGVIDVRKVKFVARCSLKPEIFSVFALLFSSVSYYSHCET